MLADQIITDCQTFAAMGYDVFVFPYREIITDLDARSYALRSFYGIYFGGVLLLDALRDDYGHPFVDGQTRI